ncbi:hypothetical protein Tco_1074054 [Tanacetum coccineum]
MSKEANREDGVEISNTKENVGNNDSNDEETIKEKSINSDDIQKNLDSVLSNEGIEGVFGTADNEEHSDTELDCDISQCLMQGNNGNNVDQMSSSYASMVKSTISEECGGRYGIAEIDKWKNGCYMFKFKDEKGISALASGLGKPMLMETMTANMCHKGIGNLSYARVLVEMDAAKELKTEIEIQYIDKGKHIKGSKKGGAEMNDKAGTITDEKVNDNNGKGKGIQQESANIKEHGQWKFYRNKNNRNGENSKKEYRKKQNVTELNEKNKEYSNQWKVGEEVVNEIRNSANKYYVLYSLPEDNDSELRTLKERIIVVKFLKDKVQLTIKESITWSKDMIEYFKTKWDEDRLKESNVGNDTGEIKDVLELNEGTAKVIRDNEVSGIMGGVLNEESYGL